MRLRSCAYDESMKLMSIGQLAGSAGVPASTVRYYERSGLLKPDERSGGNYRQYHPKSAEKLRFIRSAQAVGLSLKEVAEMLELTESPKSPCGDVIGLLQRRLDEVREKLKALRRVERTLAGALNTCCKGDRRSLCDAIEHLKRL
jgi:DNA-binding transcriptional MerR regulator